MSPGKKAEQPTPHDDRVIGMQEVGLSHKNCNQCVIEYRIALTPNA
jgi:hypothetical protein